MTFPEALTFANETGWVIYQLCQACSAADPPWRCTLREAEGGYRRQVTNGKGDSPEEAIVDALGKAPEPEDEVGASDIVVATGDRIPDLLAMLVGKPQGQTSRTR